MKQRTTIKPMKNQSLMQRSGAVLAALSLLVYSTLPARAQQAASARQTTSAPAAASASEIERRVEAILKQMTLEEKIDLLGGVNDFFIRDLPRLHLPRLKMADGPLGVRNFGPATAMAAGISLAASWNPLLAQQVGSQIGRDARAKGVHFLLGPGVNIYRAPVNGRNFEYYGEDPYLASRIAVGYIKGVQEQGVSATVKHLMGNNSEYDRHNTDSIIEERAMREIYLPVFEAAVKEAGVGAVMDSYNLVNGEHMTQNGRVNKEVVKEEWGFAGVMMSDWVATYDAERAANGGLDLEMPSGAYLNRKNLLPLIAEGKVSVATIDEKVRRIVRTAVRFGWLDGKQQDFSIPRYNKEGREAALEGAREGMVLLKNEGNLLPLNKQSVKSIAVIGPDAHPAVPVGGGSARVEPFHSVSFLEGLGRYQGAAGVQVYYARGVPPLSELAEATEFSTDEKNGAAGLRAEYFTNKELQGVAAVARTEPHINFGRQLRSFPEQTLSSRWSGYYMAREAGEYELFAGSTGEDGGFYRLFVDDRLVFDNWTSARALIDSAALNLEPGPHKILLEQRTRSARLGTRMQLGIAPRRSIVEDEAKRLAASADVVVVAVGFEPGSESEGADRTFQLPPGQDQLIREMVAANKRSIVVVTSGGGVDMSAWVDRVPALIEAWYPGQEGGTALAEILFGEVNPSGRLPVTFERRWEDNPVHDSYYPAEGTNRVVYQEGVFVGYRGYEKNGVRPLFPFGYGLSYTTFTYGNLSIKPLNEQRVNGSTTAPRYEVSFDLRNTGRREGAEVAQVYVSDKHAQVQRPPKELKGFVKVRLRLGERRRVSVILDARAFTYYDATAKRWRAEPGEFEVLVGRSSAQVELRGKLMLAAPITLVP